MNEKVDKETLSLTPSGKDLVQEHLDIPEKFQHPESNKVLASEKSFKSTPDLAPESTSNENSRNFMKKSLSRRSVWEIEAAEFPPHETPKVGR